MKNYLAELFAPNAQGKTNAFGSNPDTLSLANLLYAQGQPFDQAIVNAAQINYQTAQQRNNEILQQQKMLKAAQEQEAMQRRQQALQQLGGQAGLNPLLFGGDFNPNEIEKLQSITNPTSEENIVFNPVTGETFIKGRTNGKLTQFSPINTVPQSSENIQPYETPVEARERRAEEREYFKELRGEVKNTNEASAAIKNVENSLKKVTTGLLSGIRQTIGNLGSEVIGSQLGTGASDLANIDASSVNLIQPFISGTKGAISDKEMAIFLGAVPNSRQLPATNKEIIQAMKLSIERKKEKLKAAEKWTKSKKPINEFEVFWQEYINSNPIIEQNNDGKFIIHPENLKNWDVAEEVKIKEKVAPALQSNNLSDLDRFAQEAISKGANPEQVYKRLNELKGQ